MVKTGLEIIKGDFPLFLRQRRIGLLCNQASVDIDYKYSWKIIYELAPNHLKAIFSPQHGFFAQKQDNMKESPDVFFEELKIPIFSLYSSTRSPLKNQLDLIDTLIVDIQDVGCRVYTFIWTIFLCMIECNKFNKEVVILDRPNPINGITIEGTLLDMDYKSFVGIAPIPMRHGMTVGELALYFKDFAQLNNLELRIVKMEGWRREMYFDETGLPWVFPSPNMPSLNTAMVYPGQVIFEGTNISEGRGTTLPFEVFGAPFLDCNAILRELDIISLNVSNSGFILRRQDFEPTFNKYMGELCRGFHIHITNREKFNSFLTSVYLLSVIKRIHRDFFRWKEPPYEYEFNRLPIEVILGDKTLFNLINNETADFHDFNRYLERDLAYFKDFRKKYLIY